MRVQEFIELVKKDKKVDAVMHARKYLTATSEKKSSKEEQGDQLSLTEEQSSMVKKVMAALIYGPNTTLAGYKELFEDERWSDLIDQFTSENYKLNGMTTEPILYLVLRSGLSALKTPLSYNEKSFNINDPLCNETYQELAKDLPFAHHHHSKIVCRITGDIMDDNNPAMVLPNNNVYSLKGLEELAKKNKGVIVDPRTGQSFSLSDAKRVYIL